MTLTEQVALWETTNDIETTRDSDPNLSSYITRYDWTLMA